MTKVITTLQEYREIQQRHFKNLSVGFVPTMGALHEGHITLMQKARRENDICVCSIFVNPTQFNNATDLEKYPKTFQEDLEKLAQVQVDYLFFPNFKEIYPDNYEYKVTENEFSKFLCGKFRPGHFDGVLTVVMRLFNIIQPTRAYFGEKDYQQYKLIDGMAKAFFMPTEVIPVPTVRDDAGLALSSRNVRLSEVGLEKARLFAKILKQEKPTETVREDLTRENFDVEYLEEHFNRRFAAVYIEGVRLIDNVSL